MIDTVQKIYDLLATDDGGTNTLYDYTAARVWCPVAPADYKNAAAALVYHIANETSHTSDTLHRTQATFKCYGGSASYTAARTVYRALHDRLHGRASYADSIIRAEQLGAAQDLADPETGWPFVLVQYGLAFSQT